MCHWGFANGIPCGVCVYAVGGDGAGAKYYCLKEVSEAREMINKLDRHVHGAAVHERLHETYIDQEGHFC